MDHFYQNIDGFSEIYSQGTLLNVFIPVLSTTNKLNIAEIGVLNGRLTAMWSVMLLDNDFDFNYYAIDNRPNFVETLDITLKPVMAKITIINESSIVVCNHFPDQFFDIIYIDANHSYDDVLRDIISWYPKVKDNGFICGDDYLDFFPGVIKAVNECFVTSDVINEEKDVIFGIPKKINITGSHPQWWVMKTTDIKQWTNKKMIL